jgi:hypothetical protein
MPIKGHERRNGTASNDGWQSSCRGKESNVSDLLPMLTQASTTLVSIVIGGGLVMIPLLTSSVVALTVIFERLVFWRRLRVRKKEPQQFPLMTCEPYATMVTDSSIRVSTIHFRLMQRFS